MLDVGSNTVHLLVVDAHHGARPTPAYSHKVELRLVEHLTDDGHIDRAGADALAAFVAEAMQVAGEQGVEDCMNFATSAIREAPNGEQVLARVADETGVELHVLAGSEEAQLTFLAVRRWFGWSSGRLLVLDIGGGSLEIASGIDEEPDVATSLPLGAGRLTRRWLPGDPPKSKEVKALRRHVRAEVARHAVEICGPGPADHAVGTSKTLRSLACITGAAPSAEGPYVRRTLSADALAPWIPKIAGMASEERTRLPAVSPGRARQLLAGAMVADAAMDQLGIAELAICPWAAPGRSAKGSSCDGSTRCGTARTTSSAASPGRTARVDRRALPRLAA